MSDLAFHPIADVFPLMGEREVAELAEDIREHGQREPIVLHQDGSILDGRNRYRACRIAGVEPECETYAGDDPVSYVVSLNLKRRHLDESQRAMVAAKIANLRHGGDRSKAPNGALPGIGRETPVTQADAAEMLNVSERSVERAATVQREGAPNIIDAVERGEVAVSAAAKAVRVAPKETQETWSVGDIKRAAKEAALGGTKLPTPKQAEALSREQGGAYVVGSDGKFHVHLTEDQQQLKEDWYSFKGRLFGWSDFEVTPERALAATPSYQRAAVAAEVAAAQRWLARFEKIWGKANVV